jgi:hypothetical protein
MHKAIDTATKTSEAHNRDLPRINPTPRPASG